MTNRYKCNPKLKLNWYKNDRSIYVWSQTQTQIDTKMTDQYKYSPKTQTQTIQKWLINISAVLNLNPNSNRYENDQLI